ncbi:hypothetical protein Efla_000536 [Eimeria flavescens]
MSTNLSERAELILPKRQCIYMCGGDREKRIFTKREANDGEAKKQIRECGKSDSREMDRLNRIIRKLESEDPSRENGRWSFLSREGAALAIPCPPSLTHALFRCDSRGDWRRGDHFSRREAEEDFATTVAAISGARSFNLDLHDAGLHISDYVEGLRFRISVAGSQSFPQRTLHHDAWREFVAAREGLQEAERSKEDSGKSAETTATLTAERDEQKSANGKLCGEKERLPSENDVVGKVA